MTPKYLVLVVLFFAALGQSRSEQDAPSAFDECRLVKPSDLIDKDAPRFTDFHVSISPVRASPQLDLKSNPIAKTYRTVLRQEIAQEPNFAGHYRVAIWGCGSSCAMFAVVHLPTGRVLTAE